MYTELLDLYEKLEPLGVVAPPAHTSITPKIGVLLDCYGNFMGSMLLDEAAIIPCTEKSEYRTSGICPHLIHDNLSYVGNMPGYEKRFAAYMGQLEEYASHVEDPLAKAVSIHASSGLLLDELKPITGCTHVPLERVPVIFGIPGMETTINLKWMEYYVSTLPINGTCSILGEPAYIPESYPRNLRWQGDLAKLLQKPGRNMVTGMPNCAPGYIASQKICHTIQWLFNAPDVWMADGDTPYTGNERAGKSG